MADEQITYAQILSEFDNTIASRPKISRHEADRCRAIVASIAKMFHDVIESQESLETRIATEHKDADSGYYGIGGGIRFSPQRSAISFALQLTIGHEPKVQIRLPVRILLDRVADMNVVVVWLPESGERFNVSIGIGADGLLPATEHGRNISFVMARRLKQKAIDAAVRIISEDDIRYS